MLVYLKVKNLAVIDEAVLEVHPGFVCLTGETGAGKSLVLDALSLLSGMRASTDLVRSGCEKAIVEAEFQVDDVDLELIDGDALFLRREINRNGRSRAFVNGVAVPNHVLQRYAECAFEIFGQSGQQVLLKPASHLAIFDQFAGLEGQAQDLGLAVEEFKGALKDYWKAMDQEAERLKQIDFLHHQMAEIDAVGPDAEDDDIDRKLNRAYNRELIRQKRLTVDELIDRKMVPDLVDLTEDVGKLAEFEPALGPYLEQLASMQGLLDELRRDVDGACEEESSGGDLDKLQARHSDLNRLFMKYGRNVGEVQAERKRLETELERLKAQQADSQKGWQLLVTRYADLVSKRDQLVARRRKALKAFDAGVSSELSRLSFPRASFQTQFEAPTWLANLPEAREIKLQGSRMQFLFSPNPGEDARPLAKIASGGELSRIMLALITTINPEHRRTMVFDEVDAGIGGETATHVGRRLARLGRGKQVICVTHLAQVACVADQHYKIEKYVIDGRTHTRLVLCDRDQRVSELARLMGGDPSSESLRRHAEAMMEGQA